MADMISSGLSWLAGQLKTNVSQTVTYKRGIQSVSIQATFASQILRTSDGQGNSKIERPDADFVFTTADLNFGSGVVEPAAGDIVQVVFGAVTKQFKLMPMAGGSEPAWRYCDAYQIEVRCHTKFIGTI